FVFGGQTLLFLFLLPSIAWPLMGMLRLGNEGNGRSWSTSALIIGLVMAGLLSLVDVDELTTILLQSTNELFAQLIQATMLTIVIGRVLGFILWLARNKLPQLSLGWPIKAAAALVWTAVLALLILKPNAGFHGDHLFVILSDQADVSAAADIADIDQRRQFVYDTLTAHAHQSQAPLRQALDRFHIGYQPYYLVNAVEVEGGLLVRLWLSQFDGVDRVLHNPELRPLTPRSTPPLELIPPSDPPDSTQWNLTLIGADRVWQEFGVRGAGITLGESDYDVQWDHPELLDSYRGQDGDHNYNWLDAWEGEPVPYDLNGHGTHTTATVVGNNVGVAPDAEWFACANLVRNLGDPGKYLACMQFMLAPTPLNGDPFTAGDTTLAADVLNNSWGCPTLEGCDPTTLETAVTHLRAAGIFVVASGGNEGAGGCNTVADPIALYDASFTVGAHDASGRVAGFSSRGTVTADGSNRTKPDILAPGVSVLSAIPNDQNAHFDGTSMAGPHVAGVVALIWSANPSLIGDIDATERILVETAVPYDYTANGTPECGDPHTTPDNAVGYGLVNAYAAVKMALAK
ncbi:MAG: S8 family serine peptidase, partial [Anaerolineales bacterium]|nr:S8 family serine peptidase [Anaerolineales bacterium]